jgi:hypothetical protein
VHHRFLASYSCSYTVNSAAITDIIYEFSVGCDAAVQSFCSSPPPPPPSPTGCVATTLPVIAGGAFTSAATGSTYALGTTLVLGCLPGYTLSGVPSICPIRPPAGGRHGGASTPSATMSGTGSCSKGGDAAAAAGWRAGCGGAGLPGWRNMAGEDRGAAGQDWSGRGQRVGTALCRRAGWLAGWLLAGWDQAAC